MAFNLYELKWFLQDNEMGVTYFAIFFLLFVMIFWILKKTIFKKDEERKFAAIVAIIVSGIGVWYLSTAGFETFIELYKFVGIILLFGLPLLLLIVFMAKMNIESYIRKLAIAAYGIVIYYIAINRGIEISQQTILIGALIVLFAILFENSISKAISEKK
jgi:hypothetical protein